MPTLANQPGKPKKPTYQAYDHITIQVPKGKDRGECQVVFRGNAATKAEFSLCRNLCGQPAVYVSFTIDRPDIVFDGHPINPFNDSGRYQIVNVLPGDRPETEYLVVGISHGHNFTPELPVLICGARNGEISDYAGSQKFVNFAKAEAMYPELNPYLGSENFTEARVHEGVARFDTWAHDRALSQ